MVNPTSRHRMTGCQDPKLWLLGPRVEEEVRIRGKAKRLVRRDIRGLDGRHTRVEWEQSVDEKIFEDCVLGLELEQVLELELALEAVERH
jgi:hypothetical protein